MTDMVNKVFQWNGDFILVKKLFEKVIDRKLIKNADQILQGDYPPGDLSWIANFSTKLGNDHSSISLNLIKCFKDQFDLIRLYHCCCPSKLSSYYMFGLKMLEHKNQHETFTNIANNFMEPREINKAIDEHVKVFKNLPGNFFEEIRHRIYFYLDKMEAFGDGKSFYNNGSEYFCQLAGRTQYGSRIQQSKLGIPTIFTVDLPVDFLDQANLLYIVKNMSTRWADLVIYKNKYHKLGGGIDINKNIPPTYITRHCHPENSTLLNEQSYLYCDKCKKNISRVKT